MRLVIVGAGGTGGYFGAKLARSGEDVTFLARGAHLKASRALAFADACCRAAIPAEAVQDIRTTLWRKYVSIAPIAGATALTRLPVKFIREIPETHRRWQMQIEELLALASRENVGLEPDMMERCTKFLESLAPTNYSSLYQDLVQGKRLELDAMHGYAVKLGMHHAIPTPALFLVYAALKPYIGGPPA